MNRYRNTHHGASGVRRRRMRPQGAFRGAKGGAAQALRGDGPCKFGQTVNCCNPSQGCTKVCCIPQGASACPGGCF